MKTTVVCVCVILFVWMIYAQTIAPPPAFYEQESNMPRERYWIDALSSRAFRTPCSLVEVDSDTRTSIEILKEAFDLPIQFDTFVAKTNRVMMNPYKPPIWQPQW